MHIRADGPRCARRSGEPLLHRLFSTHGGPTAGEDPIARDALRIVGRMDPPQRCKMNVYGSDGLGRRVEAVFNCVAIAEAFGLTYLHAPFRRLQPPGTNVTKVNGWFGLTASLGPTKSEYSLIRSLQRNRTSRSPVLTSHLTDCRAETSVNATTRTLGSVDR